MYYSTNQIYFLIKVWAWVFPVLQLPKRSMKVCKNFRKKKIVAVLNYINITLGGGIKM